MKEVTAYSVDGRLYFSKQEAEKAEWQEEIRKLFGSKVYVNSNPLTLNSSIYELIEQMDEDIMEVLMRWRG